MPGLVAISGRKGKVKFAFPVEDAGSGGAHWNPVRIPAEDSASFPFRSGIGYGVNWIPFPRFPGFPGPNPVFPGSDLNWMQPWLAPQASFS
eukprot:gene13827-biopygen9559